jgi:hypothetical protein
MEFPKDIPQLIFAVILIGIGVLFMLYNFMIFHATVIRRREASSVLPIFGGIFACAGMIIIPVEGTAYYSWIPILLDWGGLPIFVSAYIENKLKKKKKNRRGQ